MPDDQPTEWDNPGFWKALHLRELMRRTERLRPPGSRDSEQGMKTTDSHGIGAPSIRDRVFTPELRELAQTVQSHRSDEPSSNLIHTFEELGPPLTGLAASVARLYLSRESELPDQLLPEWNRRFSALASALMLFSRDEGVFRLILSSGLDKTQMQNFWISARDPFFEREEVQSFTIDRSLKENPFFAKRFSFEFLASLGGIVTVPRDDRTAPAMLVFFFDSDPPELPLQELKSSLDWIHPLLVRHLDKEKPFHQSRNIYEQAAREVRAFLNLSDGATLLQCHFGALVDGEICHRFLKELRRVLAHQRNGLILRLRHDGLKILLAPEVSPEALLETIVELAGGFGIEVKSFQMQVTADHVSSAVL